jgi:hypothetical protein
MTLTEKITKFCVIQYKNYNMEIVYCIMMVIRSV